MLTSSGEPSAPQWRLQHDCISKLSVYSFNSAYSVEKFDTVALDCELPLQEIYRKVGIE